MKNAITIRQLAQLSGFSRTSVSLALRDSPRVSPENRAKIKELALKHGYVRDTVVSSLMARLRVSKRNRTTDILAYLTWGDTRDGASKNPFGLQSSEGVFRRANNLGYEVEYFWAREPGMTGARLSRILYTRGIRGIIIGSMYRARGRVSLDWPRFAAATTNYTLLKPALHRATSSHYQGMIMALRNLRQHGFNRVGYINLLSSEDMVNEIWLAGYMAYQFRMHGRVEVPPLLLENWDREIIGKWLEKNKPQVVISNDPQCLDTMKALGMRIPGEIGFVLLDCPPGETDCAGIHQGRDRSGAAVVDLVVEQLEANEFGLPNSPKTVLVDPEWKTGPTIRTK